MIVDRTVFGILFRGLVGGRRALVLAVVALLPVIAAIAHTTGDVDPDVYWARLVQRLLIPVVTAFVAAVVGAGAIADEREDGTILYLASTPLRRVTIIASAVAAAWVASLLIVVPSLLVSAVIVLGGDVTPGAVGWPLFGVVVASLAYCAAGAWVAMVIRHPVVACVLYILLWEGTFATWTDSAQYFSIAAYARAISLEGIPEVIAAEVGAATGALVLAALIVVAVTAAGRRLSRTELP